MTRPLTLLGFDFGEKRIGIAVGQTLTQTANPLEILPATKGKPDWDKLDAVIEQWQPQALVVGDPVTMDGEQQRVSKLAQKFSSTLQSRYKLPVYRMDETLSSFEARRRVKSTYDLDATAAQAILETWLNEHVSADGVISDTILHRSQDGSQNED